MSDNNYHNKKGLFFYFFNLEDSNPTVFEDRWKAISAHQFTPKEYSTIIHRVAKTLKNKTSANATKARAFIQNNLSDWENGALEIVSQFDSQNLSNSLWALATLGVRPSDAFGRAWEGRAIEIIDRFNSQELSNSLWALATLGVRPSDAFGQAWEARAVEIMDRFNSQELSNSLWALAILNVTGAHTHNIANIIYHHIKTPLSDNRAQSAYAQACLWFGWGIKGTIPEEKDTSSQLENHIQTALERAGIAIDGNLYIPALGHKVDLTFTFNQSSEPQRQVLLEIDGPPHFIGNHYNGSTLLQSALIGKYTANDTTLLRMHFAACNRILSADDTEQRALIMDIVRQTADQPDEKTLHVLERGGKLKVLPIEFSY